jgi:hypothetical protein
MTTIPGALAGHQPPASNAHIGGHAAGIEHYADLVEQLFREYESILSLSGIVALVNQCRHDLAGSPATAMPELLERLARWRLSVLAKANPVRREDLGVGEPGR